MYISMLEYFDRKLDIHLEFTLYDLLGCRAGIKAK